MLPIAAARRFLRCNEVRGLRAYLEAGEDGPGTGYGLNLINYMRCCVRRREAKLRVRRI